jgi:hypothetical protein
VPNIDACVIVEYKYRELLTDAGAKGMRLAFQRDIPVQTLSYLLQALRSQEPRYKSYNFTDAKFVKNQKGFWLATRKNVPSFREEPRMPPEDYGCVRGFADGYECQPDGRIGNLRSPFTVKDPSNPKPLLGGRRSRLYSAR